MNHMKQRIFSCLMAVFMTILGCFPAYALPEWPSDTGIMAEGGIVIDADSGAVLFGQNIHLPYPPASITKLLTALVVIENSNLEDTVTFSRNAIYDVEEGSGNKLSLDVGDELTVEDSLYVLLLLSSNQAANALAEHVAGSREAFVGMMNQKLVQLGCRESHFANPSGLNSDEQYVSAYDMAVIARACFANEKLLEIDSAKSHRIPATINNPDGASFNMEHRLLMTEDPDSEYYCEGAMAGKTGYTSLAGNTLVTYASRSGQNLIAVVLKGTQPQYYLDSRTLLEFGFANFQNLKIQDYETSYTAGTEAVAVGENRYEPSDLYLDSEGVITLPRGVEFSMAQKELITELTEDAPQGAVALVQYTYDERKIGSAWLCSASLAQEQAKAGQPQLESSSAAEPVTAQPEGWKPDWRIVGVAAVIAVILAAAAALILRSRKERQRREEALAQLRLKRRKRLQEAGYTEEEFEQLYRQRYGRDMTRQGKDTQMPQEEEPEEH